MVDEITVCMPIAFKTGEDAYYNLVAKALESYRICDPTNRLHLSVSTMFDVSGCIEFLKDHWRSYERELTVTVMNGKEYNHGRAKTESIMSADTDRLFVTDSDNMVPEDFLRHYDENISEDVLWFPTSFGFFEGKKQIIHPDNGAWRESTYNTIGAFRSTFFMHMGDWCCDYSSGYYRDDMESYYKAMKLKRKGVRIVRDRMNGFLHPWHPKTTEWHNKKELVGR